MFFLKRNWFNEKGFDSYRTQIVQSGYETIKLNDILLDEIFVDQSAKIPVSTIKPNKWNISTSLNAKFLNNLEGGSIQAENNRVERVRFYKRRKDTIDWIVIGEIEFDGSEQKRYIMYDEIVRNDFEYQYAVSPVTMEIIGNKVISDYVKVNFEGCFLSDKENNYAFMYNVDEGVITHNINIAEFKPLAQNFPIYIKEMSDYKSGGLDLVYFYGDIEKDNMSISTEFLARENLMNFLKNGKPKFLKFDNGEAMIINVVSNPTEKRMDGKLPISEISFNYSEIDKVSTESVIHNDLFKEIKESEHNG